MKTVLNNIKIYSMSLLVAGVAGGFASCDDFFEPETADALSGDDYMSSTTEMTTGFLGIMTKMQAIGDKAIYLTDTRGEMLEPTDQSIAELIAIYNYDDDLSGNSYADPAGYYDVIIACNDYMANMQDFIAKYPERVGETDYYNGLYASAIRVKAWAYLTLAEIYGQALWFDDPITEVKDVTDTSVFQHMETEQIVDKCLALLTTPAQVQVNADSVRVISPTEEFSWREWIDPETAVANSVYRYWDMMTPPYFALYAKLSVWKGAFQDQRGEDATQTYKSMCKVLQDKFKQYWGQYTHYWKRCPTTPGHYSAFWNNANPYQEEVVGAIIYDYTKNQTNQMLYHFSDEYPNAYLLRSNESARARFTDTKVDPLGTQTQDSRLNVITKQNGNNWYISKYRPVGSSVRVNAYQDDVHIYTFRCSELFLWLAEALNHLGRYEALDRVINNGFGTADYDKLLEIENGNDSAVIAADSAFYANFYDFHSYWAIPTSTDRYGTYNGFRGCLSLGAVDIWDETSHTAEEAQRHNDELLANEWMFECACEGKVYPNMIRFAERYADPTIVSDRVAPKYETATTGVTPAAVAAKIAADNAVSGVKGYYVPWNLYK
ncbi:MAG: RagB/SusD family nutrient uptake outer membrane protein [Bacteroidales bacterium]|nr:RagB/SusD family nutrient uptake outer membrane protein [Bacteroidales bacterium]